MSPTDDQERGRMEAQRRADEILNEQRRDNNAAAKAEIAAKAEAASREEAARKLREGN